MGELDELNGECGILLKVRGGQLPLPMTPERVRGFAWAFGKNVEVEVSIVPGEVAF